MQLLPFRALKQWKYGKFRFVAEMAPLSGTGSGGNISPFSCTAIP
jgi:hypothetical protein